MFKTKTAKILAVVAVFLLIIFSWVLIKDAQKKRAAEMPPNNGLENPFGKDESENDLQGSSNTETDSDISNNIPPEIIPIAPGSPVTIIENNPLLKKLSDKAVAGFTFIKDERIIEEELGTTPDAGIVEVYDFSGYKTVRFGDNADEITAIKTVLNRQTPSPGLVINTNYDTDMKNAAIDFQNRNGLTGDGVIGPKTYAKLNIFQGITTFSPVKKPKNIEIVEMVRFVEKGSGLMFDKAVRKQEEVKAITTNPIPKIVEAFFDNTGKKLIMRYLKDDVIQTYLVNLAFREIPVDATKEERDAISKTATVSGEFMPENIKTVSVSKDKKNLFYLNPVSGGVAGITYAFATKAKKQIFDSALTEWNADYGSDIKINLTTRASGLVDGYAYIIDTKTSAFTKTLGGMKGLTTLLSPDGKKIIYAVNEGNKISTFLVDISTSKTSQVSPSAFPEKCVWKKDSTKVYCAAPVRSSDFLYPDDWYKGKITFDDALWMIDLSDMSGNIIYDFIAKNNQRIDATNLTLNQEEDYIGFINKKDGILWGFDLNR